MKKQYFKVNLNNDETKEFDIVCCHSLLSVELRDVIMDRVIFKSCSDPLCLINSGLTYDSAVEISKEEALKIVNTIKENEEILGKYEAYLDSVEENSVEEYNKKLISYKNIKKRKRTR